MLPANEPRIGLLAIRVSSDKQGLDGDSPEAQREQGEAYAKAHNIIIIDTIILMESASHELQPMQKVIDACRDKGKGIQVVLIKSIDRFTRGGGDYYSPPKNQLTVIGIALEDMYGVIGKSHVNTLQHVGFKYYWSEFNPTQKSEYLDDADPDLKIRFQKMIFPEGLTFDTSTVTFGTSTISPLYRYAPNKNDLSMKDKSSLVIPRRIELRLPG